MFPFKSPSPPLSLPACSDQQKKNTDPHISEEAAACAFPSIPYPHFSVRRLSARKPLQASDQDAARPVKCLMPSMHETLYQISASFQVLFSLRRSACGCFRGRTDNRPDPAVLPAVLHPQPDRSVLPDTVRQHRREQHRDHMTFQPVLKNARYSKLNWYIPN